MGEEYKIKLSGTSQKNSRIKWINYDFSDSFIHSVNGDFNLTKIIIKKNTNDSFELKKEDLELYMEEKLRDTESLKDPLKELTERIENFFHSN